MIRVALILVLAAASLAPLEAVTLSPMTFEQLVDEATAVVYARVADVRGRWTADRRNIESIVSLDALRYLKGNLGESVEVRVPGGQAGGMRQVMPGAPVLREGELVVAFVGAQGPAIPTLVGFTQGLFRVVVDARSGSAYVTPPPLKASAAGAILRGAAHRRTLTVAAFAAEVEAQGRH
jgi:hypothetical protein